MNELILKDCFFDIKAKNFIVGVNKDTIEMIFPEISDADIKKEYLYHSYPETIKSIETFLIGKDLITVNEFSDFVSDTNYVTDAEKEGWGWIWEDKWEKKEGLTWEKPFGDKADSIYIENKRILPVLMLSWNDANSYCSWLAKKSGKTIGLPRESEWELFADTTGVPGMNEYEKKPREIFSNSSDYINRLYAEIKNRKDFTHTGIIWEWTQDWFDAYAPGNDNKEYGKIYKVLRGGSMLSNGIQRTRQYRFRRCPTARSPFYGFRIIIKD